VSRGYHTIEKSDLSDFNFERDFWISKGYKPEGSIQRTEGNFWYSPKYILHLYKDFD